MCEQGTITQSLKVPLLPEPRGHKTLQKTPRSQDLLKAQQFPNNFFSTLLDFWMTMHSELCLKRLKSICWHRPFSELCL